MSRELVCIVCPLGCVIDVQCEKGKIARIVGNKCLHGKEYAEEETLSPKRTLTTAVQLKGGDFPLLSVRTEKPIPKERLFEAMDVLRKVRVSAPVEIGQVVVENLLGLGVDVVATRKAAARTVEEC